MRLLPIRQYFDAAMIAPRLMLRYASCGYDADAAMRATRAARASEYFSLRRLMPAAALPLLLSPRHAGTRVHMLSGADMLLREPRVAAQRYAQRALRVTRAKARGCYAAMLMLLAICRAQECCLRCRRLILLRHAAAATFRR